MSIGVALSPVLVEIECALFDHEAHNGSPPHFTDDGFRAALKIFMSAALDKMFALQSTEDMPIDVRCQMALRLGEELRTIVKTYTDIDTHTLYK